MMKCRLRSYDVFPRTLPDFQRGRLERASEGETQLPGNVARPANGVQPLRRDFITLPTRKKHDSRHRGGHSTTQTMQGCFGHYRIVSLLWTLRARQYHTRLEEHLLQHDAIIKQRAEHTLQRGVRDLFA